MSNEVEKAAKALHDAEVARDKAVKALAEASAAAKTTFRDLPPDEQRRELRKLGVKV